MVWIVIVLVVAAAVGPIVWLMPSKASRRQSALRTAARQAGLIVEIGSVPKLDAEAAERVSAGGVAREPLIDCAVYRLPFPRRLAQAPRWTIFRSELENRFLQGWTTLKPPTRLPDDAGAYWSKVQAVVDALPGGCLAVESAAQTVGWFGRERIGDASPEDVAQAIRAGLQRLACLHERIDESGGNADL